MTSKRERPINDRQQPPEHREGSRPPDADSDLDGDEHALPGHVAKDFSDESGETIGNSSYHFRKLERLGFIKLERTGQVRGATEHFYQPVKRALAWTAESESLPPVVMDKFSATALRGLVEDAGRAIDAGTFNEREDRTLAYDKQWVDERAWGELSALFETTLAKALRICDGASQRRDQGAPGFFLASYALAMFESPPPSPPLA